MRLTTVFISDDNSDDAATVAYLDKLAGDLDFVVLRNQERLGVAGNTNRLMRCLSRFNHCLLLNDDAEVLANGWDSFYANGCVSGIYHFCMRQVGVYGAQAGHEQVVNGQTVSMVNSKPHGAILAYTSDVFKRVGYFDERFGIYGMEHVDWSSRVSASNLQPPGFYDLVGSANFFKINPDESAVVDRIQHLDHGRELLKTLDPNRGYVEPSPRSMVPTVSFIIPCRDLDRHGAITSVVNGVRAQRFPNIQIIVSEHDTARRLPQIAEPVEHVLTQSDGRPFNKAKAMNAGVAKAVSPFLVLHDADMILPAEYAKLAYDMLQMHDGCHFGKTVVYLSDHSTADVNAIGILDDTASCDHIIGYFEGGSLACRRSTYWQVGGFNEDFWGYGVEDCEFYTRLSTNSNWKEDRRIDFVHMSHGRTPDWHEQHKRNKELHNKLERIPMDERIRILRSVAANTYGEPVEIALRGIS